MDRIFKTRKVLFLDSAFNYARMQSEGVTHKSASKEMGISYSTYSKWVQWRETQKFPNETNIESIANYIGWHYDDLYIAVLAAKNEDTSIASKLESLIPPHVTHFTKKL